MTDKLTDDTMTAKLAEQREATLKELLREPTEAEKEKAKENALSLMRDMLEKIFGKDKEAAARSIYGQYLSHYGGVGNVGVKNGQGFLPDLDKFESTTVGVAYKTKMQGETYGERWKNFLEHMGTQGFHENKDAIGEISGAGRLAWCGGYTHMCAERIFGGQLFMQKNPLWARSFTDYAHKYDARVVGAPPKDGDYPVVAALPGAGASGTHVVTIIGYNDKTGKYIISEGNGGNRARVKEIDARRIVAYVDTNKLLMERAKRGEAVVGPDGQPILSMDQEVGGVDVLPQEWTKGDKALFDENGPTERLEFGRSLGKLIADGKLDNLDLALDGTKFDKRLDSAKSKLDANGDGKVNFDDIEALKKSGVQIADGDSDGKISFAEYAAAKIKHDKAPAVQQ